MFTIDVSVTFCTENEIPIRSKHIHVLGITDREITNTHTCAGDNQLRYICVGK